MQQRRCESDPSRRWRVVTLAKLLPSDGATNDWFGFSVAMGSLAAVVGSHLDDDHGVADSARIGLYGLFMRVIAWVVEVCVSCIAAEIRLVLARP